MKTILPIPEQAGFRPFLPERVRFAHGTTVQRTRAGLKLVRNESTMSIPVLGAARDCLLRELDESGTGLKTDGLSPIWRQLVERLAVCGMLHDSAPQTGASTDGIPALNALVSIIDKIFDQTLVHFSAHPGLEKLIAGKLDSTHATRWLTENYFYTKSATYHITPVLQHGMAEDERELWRRFLKDESWHWRIYRPALGQFDISYAMLAQRRPMPATIHFIETLHSIAQKSPISYAAAMIFIEKPPPYAEIDSDPLYASLMRFYGFSRASVRPLWWHATENRTAGHSNLGAIVISNRETLTQQDLNDALVAVQDTIGAVSLWHDGILADC